VRFTGKRQPVDFVHIRIGLCPSETGVNIERMPIHVVIPAHNEARSIENVLLKVRGTFPNAHIAVVNDGSTDDTSRRARAANATVIDLPFNMGYGAALQTGLLWAFRQGANAVVTLDADGQHDAVEALKLVRPVLAGQADVVLGSRYLNGVVCYRVPWSRRIGAWVFAKTLSILAGTPITDPTTGFQCLSAKALRAYVQLKDFPEKTPDADLVLYAQRSGCRIAEVPTAMYEDESHDSMHGILKSMFYVPNMFVSLFGMFLIPRPLTRSRAR